MTINFYFILLCSLELNRQVNNLKKKISLIKRNCFSWRFDPVAIHFCLLLPCSLAHYFLSIRYSMWVGFLALSGTLRPFFTVAFPRKYGGASRRGVNPRYQRTYLEGRVLLTNAVKSLAANIGYAYGCGLYVGCVGRRGRGLCGGDGGEASNCPRGFSLAYRRHATNCLFRINMHY